MYVFFLLVILAVTSLFICCSVGPAVLMIIHQCRSYVLVVITHLAAVYRPTLVMNIHVCYSCLLSLIIHACCSAVLFQF